MTTHCVSFTSNKHIARLVTLLALVLLTCSAVLAAELPVLHLRKVATPPNLCSRLMNPAVASGWYQASPTWFGLGGLTGDRNHTEVLVTYDDTALYVGFLNIDRSSVICPAGTIVPLNTVDSNTIWIQTAQGRSFYFMGSIDTNYPPQTRRASGQFPSYDPKTDKLTGWQSKGWYAGNKTMEQTMIIPWSTMSTTAPAPGSRLKINFLNYNQVSPGSTSTTNPTAWAPGSAGNPSQWGSIAFDEAVFNAPTNISPEAVFTIRPASGFGGEAALRAGNGAAQTSGWPDAAVTESNWNDWDPIDYTMKEYMQFDLSNIPSDRTIISATLFNSCRGNYNSNPTPQNLHVVRLAGSYDPSTVTMLTSPAPVENGCMRTVPISKAGWVKFDVTDVVTKALAGGLTKATFALAGSTGDQNNGKIWNIAAGRADWYNGNRPMLVITFGRPGVSYSAPVTVGSLNYTSVATSGSKNKLTNGTFRYGQVEGITNTTYWQDNGYAYLNGQNVPFMVMAGDYNPSTSHPALRFMTPVKWQYIMQKATGIVPRQPYTFSGWYKGSVAGQKSDVRLSFCDASGNQLVGSQAVYSGSGNWEKVKLTTTAPAGTAYCLVSIYNWTSGTGTYMLYSDLQLEAGTQATTYSETMGVYYPNYPRTDGVTN